MYVCKCQKICRKSETLHQQNQSVQDWEDEGTTLARQFSTVLVYDAEEGVWRPTDAPWKHLVFWYFIHLILRKCSHV